MEDERTSLLALAGLLHDVGKFMLRASVGGQLDWRAPENQLEFGHKHTMLTDTFIAEAVPEPWRASVRGLAGRHHRPQNHDERLIQLADHLSAGERDDVSAEADEAPRAKHPPQLLSIFCRVTADGLRAADSAYVPLRPLELVRESLFPGPALTGDEVWRRYQDLWSAFSADAYRLRDAHAQRGDLPTYIESLQLLLQRYTWCVPSAYFGAVPDISLYDRSRMTAALAAVLARQPLDEAQLDRLIRQPERSSDEIALLVGGDVSGVQDFIYTISSRGATPALRGRSFYVQLLTEAVARFLLHELDLPITNLIYVGGGNIYIVARPGDGKRLEEAQRRISRILLRHHRGELYAALAHQPLQAQDFAAGRLGQAWQALHRRFQRSKNQRFSELGPDFAELFEPVGYEGVEEGICQVCGLEHPGTKSVDETRRCPPCIAFEELGDDLRNARYLAFDSIEPAQESLVDDGQGAGDWRAVLRALGLEAQLATDVDSLRPPPLGARQTVFALRDEAMPRLTPASDRAVGRRLLVNTTPLLGAEQRTGLLATGKFDAQELPPPGRVKPFSVLEYESAGVKRLGILRMDVDHLGQIFATGLGDRASLSRVASLSFAVSLFFDGWVGALAEQRAQGPAGGRLYAIYSGGDDLFFVGAWDAVLDLADDIRRDLTPYAANHPGIHASAGIVLTGGKYPLSQAAREAGDAEHMAKAAGRNTIAFLGQAVPWRGNEGESGDFEHVRSRMLQVSHWIGAGHVPRSFIMALRAIDAEWRAWVKQESGQQPRYRHVNTKLYLGPWQWHLVYNLTRAADRVRDAGTKREIKDYVQAIVGSEIETVGMTARWVELRTWHAGKTHEQDNG